MLNGIKKTICQHRIKLIASNRLLVNSFGMNKGSVNFCELVP